MTVNYPEFAELWGAIGIATEIGSYFLFAILVLFLAAYLYDRIFNR